MAAVVLGSTGTRIPLCCTVADLVRAMVGQWLLSWPARGGFHDRRMAVESDRGEMPSGGARVRVFRWQIIGLSDGGPLADILSPRMGCVWPGARGALLLRGQFHGRAPHADGKCRICV